MKFKKTIQSENIENVIDNKICYKLGSLTNLKSLKVKTFETFVSFKDIEACEEIYGPTSTELDKEKQGYIFTREHSSLRIDMNNIELSIYDYKYKIRFSTLLKSYLTIDIQDYDMFIKNYMKNETTIYTREFKTNILTVCTPLIKRFYLDTLRKHEISVFESLKNYREINANISARLNKYLKKYGIIASFALIDVSVEESKTLKILNNLILESAQMKKLQYEYKDEYCIELNEYLKKSEEVG